jgi:hypothetical protein
MPLLWTRNTSFSSGSKGWRRTHATTTCRGDSRRLEWMMENQGGSADSIAAGWVPMVFLPTAMIP